MAAESRHSNPRRGKCLDEDWGMPKDSTVSVEKEQERTPLLKALPGPKQATFAVNGQHVVVVEQRWVVCDS